MTLIFQQINTMLTVREEQFEGDHILPYPEGKQKRACTIFFGYTSNLVTSGVREVLFNALLRVFLFFFFHSFF